MKISMAVIIPFAGSFAPALRPVLARLAQASLLALLVTAAAQAQSKFEEDFDDLDKPWQEIAIQLPAAPKLENLVEFDVGERATMTFAVDVNSISAGDDGVVRYTLVSSSPSGAENISYEGIRCETRERKLYAFGRKDGSWSRSRRDQWEMFTGTVANRQHAALARGYFCSSKSVEGDAKDMARRLRDKRPLMDVMVP